MSFQRCFVSLSGWQQPARGISSPTLRLACYSGRIFRMASCCHPVEEQCNITGGTYWMSRDLGYRWQMTTWLRMCELTSCIHAISLFSSACTAPLAEHFADSFWARGTLVAHMSCAAVSRNFPVTQQKFEVGSSIDCGAHRFSLEAKLVVSSAHNRHAEHAANPYP